MEFYITPDKRQECEKKIDRMFKKFTVKPTVTYSPVQKVNKTTCVDDGHGTLSATYYKEVLDAIKVTISNIVEGEWTLVSSVYYKENIMTVVDNDLFKSIPSQYGLSYIKCDHCGSTHKNRKEAHILYKSSTDEWMQVGSSCIDKMLPNGRYFNSIALKLFETIVDRLGGCSSSLWSTWMPESHYWNAALNIDKAIMIVKSYRETKPCWQKKEFNEYGELVKESSSKELADYAETWGNSNEIDSEYVAKVAEYVNSLEGGYDDWSGEPTFNQKIKDSFENGYVAVRDMYLAFFAQKGYQDSITVDTFGELVEANGIIRGEKFTFSGKVMSVDDVETIDYMGYPTTVYLYTLKDDKTGLLFEKEVSYKGVMDTYKQEDDTYKFSGKVKYIAYKRHIIGFGGRLSKAK